MNKILLAALLMLNVCGSVVALNEEQREILYTLNDLGQDFSSVPMITENIDMFIGMLQMNMQTIKAKLRVAKQEMSEQLWKAAKTMGALLGAQIVVGGALNMIRDAYPTTKTLAVLLTDSWVTYEMFGVATVAKVFTALGIYDAYKAKNALEKALAQDKKILRKLEELKNSLPDAASVQPDSAAKKLLGNAK